MISSLVLRLDKALSGAPEELLTVGLLAVATGLILIAILGEPAHKAGALVWTLAP